MKRLLQGVVIGLLLGSVWSAAYWPAYRFRARDGGPVAAREFNEHRQAVMQAVRLLDEIRRTAGIQERINLFADYDAFGAYIDREALTGRPFIVMDPYVIAWAPLPVLRAWLAHEVGHLAAGHVTPGWNLLTWHERGLKQDEADAYGMAIIGEAAWREYLAASGLDPATIEYRIGALKAIPVRLPSR